MTDPLLDGRASAFRHVRYVNISRAGHLAQYKLCYLSSDIDTEIAAKAIKILWSKRGEKMSTSLPPKLCKMLRLGLLNILGRKEEKKTSNSFPFPTMEDAQTWLTRYARWNYVLPLPNENMMYHIGAQTVENFLCSC